MPMMEPEPGLHLAVGDSPARPCAGRWSSGLYDEFIALWVINSSVGGKQPESRYRDSH